MPKIDFIDNCSQTTRNLNFGTLRFVRKSPGLGEAVFYGPRLTHILFVDLAAPGVSLSFRDPTVEAEIDGGHPEASFVAWQLDTRGQVKINQSYPEFFDGSDWIPFTVADGAHFDDRIIRTRLRRADSTLEIQGDRDGFNGYSFRFGVYIPEGADESISFILNGRADEVRSTDAPCPRRVTVTGPGDNQPGLFPVS